MMQVLFGMYRTRKYLTGNVYVKSLKKYQRDQGTVVSLKTIQSWVVGLPQEVNCDEET